MKKGNESSFGFVRVAAAVPKVRPGAVKSNLESIMRLAKAAADQGADAVVFPELTLTGYTCADLFYQESLLDAAEKALGEFCRFVAPLPIVAFVGLPVRVNGMLFNACAVVRGGLAGVVPKTFLPSTHEFYESRWFAPSYAATAREIELCGATVPFGADLVFADARAKAVYGVELCEDMWAPNPPSTRLALRGANVIMNLSGSNELVGKTSYRTSLVTGQSARCMAGYVYAGAGVGESTTDLVFGGHTLIAENGALLAEGPRFERSEHLTFADIDVPFLEFDRSANYSWRQAAQTAADVRRIDVTTPEKDGPGDLFRNLDAHPFVPAGEAQRNARCEEIFAIQSTGLATRLEAIHCKDVVVGLSGGLDSALALLVCVEAFERLGLNRKGIHVYTMPGFGTTSRTKGNAERLAEGMGLKIETIDISSAARQHLADLGHPETKRDITYENAQARERTQVLMDKANQVGGIVIGTGDLSELALGWCTFNGDHMSMYGVNGGVPKTLVRYLVDWYAQRAKAQAAEETSVDRQHELKVCAASLKDILATPVSPELLPASKDGTIAQKTEEKVGPYDLHDFFLYHFIRRGAGKEKLRFLAEKAFAGVYDEATVDRWLEEFMRRFFTQQFKRNVLPEGPKVGSINLSPRGDWRMPGDASWQAFV